MDSKLDAINTDENNSLKQASTPSEKDEKNLVSSEGPFPVTNEKSGYNYEDEIDELPEGAMIPTDEERETLRKVPAPMPIGAFLVVIVEFAERFAFYGCSQGPFQNFIQQPLPPGSTTGAVVDGNEDASAGALNKGQQTATALTTFFSFFCYVTPILGAWVADARWGRFKTICIFTVVYFVGLVILVGASTPSAIENGAAFPVFIVSLIIIGFGTGGIKSNIAPLIADQITLKRQAVVTVPKTGERVIMDPSVTIQRLYSIFYWCINLGALSSLATTNSALHVGFWLAFSLPTIVFLLVPLTLWLGRDKYHKIAPRGSIIVEAFRVSRIAAGAALSWNPMQIRRNLTSSVDSIWDRARPANVMARTPEGARPSWLTWDSTFVDEVHRTITACKVFLFFPPYWCVYSQLSGNLVSQAANLQTRGVPNDLLSVLNPIALIIFIPIVDRGLYPLLRKLNIPFKPIKRIFVGFMIASSSMIYACVLQHYMYKQSECLANGLAGSAEYPDGCAKVNISVWAQVPAYVLIGVSEIFASITGLEYAYTKAPARMKSLVQALFLLTTAAGNAINFALVSVARDPYLVGNYAGVAIAAFVAGVLFIAAFWRLDHSEEKDNEIGRVAREE